MNSTTSILLVPFLLFFFLNSVQPVDAGEQDRLRMCPPGGSSFTMAWSMACSMRRKRSAPEEFSDSAVPFVRASRALVAPSIKQLQSICCEVGCSITDLLPYCGPLSSW